MADLLVFLGNRLAGDEQAAADAPDPGRALREVGFKRQLLAAYVSSLMHHEPDAPNAAEQRGQQQAHAYNLIDLAEFVYEDHQQEPLPDCPHCPTQRC
ncbi:MAG: hypothetical protein GEV03_24685 [Streptosporangiales bacterium]|nr:hypothetical protein [Streptosporangiales bacterium]